MFIQNKIQNTLGEAVLRRKLKSVSRRKASCNLFTATSVGVIFPIDRETPVEEIKNFLDFLAQQKTNLYVLGYCNERDIPVNFVNEKNLNIITRKDFNWFHKPLTPLIKEFISKELDILINLCISKALPVDFILSLSRARFKVGMYSERDEYHDMMIDIRKDESIAFFISQIKHYLSIINHKN